MALLALVNMMVSVIARWIAWRFQFPAIILLALTGLLAGPLLRLIHPATDVGEKVTRPYP